MGFLGANMAEITGTTKAKSTENMTLLGTVSCASCEEVPKDS
jgi:hypothetical protein